MGRKSGCSECYRLWQQYAAALVQHLVDEGELKLANMSGDAALIADRARMLHFSTRVLDNAREEMARHVATHDRDAKSK